MHFFLLSQGFPCRFSPFGTTHNTTTVRYYPAFFRIFFIFFENLPFTQKSGDNTTKCKQKVLFFRD